MSACPLHPWGLPDGDDCTLEAGHAPGCVFKSAQGSDLNDRHGEQGHG